MQIPTLLENLSAAFPEIESLGSDDWIVGGAVRDGLLQRTPGDLDVATPSASKAAGRFAAATRGRLVQLSSDPLDTFRVVVQGRIYDFTDLASDTIGHDLGRRDLTINAMALNVAALSLADPFGGVDDLAGGLVRMISEKNFADDPLRVLKAIRTAVRLRFRIVPDTARAMKNHAGAIVRVPEERVTSELGLILSDPNRKDALPLLADTELDQILFGRQLTDLDRKAFEETGSDPSVAWAILLSHLSSDELSEYSRRWKWSDELRRETLFLTTTSRELGKTPIQRDRLIPVIHEMGAARASRLLQFLRARGDVSIAVTIEKIVAREGDRIFSAVPLLSGDEIRESLLLSAGPEIGRIKRAVFEAQLRGEITTREEALKLARISHRVS